MPREGYQRQMKHPQVLVSMSAHFLRQGMTTREVRQKIASTYNVDVSLPTITSWGRKEGVELQAKKRLKPCRWCGATTKHMLTCPLVKNAPPREDPLDKYHVLV